MPSDLFPFGFISYQFSLYADFSRKHVLYNFVFFTEHYCFISQIFIKSVRAVLAIGVAKILNNDNTKCKGTLVHHWWDCRMVQPLWMAFSSAVSNKTWQILPKPSSSSPPWNLLQETENMFTQKPAHIFRAALFITAKTWKQLSCLSVGEWKDKLWWCLQTVEY